tara:strand:- start:320 stop:484 length:165 start_codon:yes stop_codon:yes gene_type:complete
VVTIKELPKEFPDIFLSYYVICGAIIEFLNNLGIKFDIYLKTSKILQKEIIEFL